MSKRGTRFTKVAAFSKMLIIQNSETRREENSMASDMSTHRPELHTQLTFTKLGLKQVSQIEIVYVVMLFSGALSIFNNTSLMFFK